MDVPDRETVDPTLAPDDPAAAVPVRDPTAVRSRGQLKLWPPGFTSVEGILFVVGGGCGLIGDQFSVPIFTSLGLLFIGLLVATVGIEQIVKNVALYNIGSWGSSQAAEMYRALLAQLWGLVFVGMGALLLVQAFSSWTQGVTVDSLVNNLLNSNTGVGLVLAVIGLMTALHGVIRTLAGSGVGARGRLAGLSSIVDRMMGALTLLFGLGLSLVGFVVLLDPGLITGLLGQLGELIVGP
jgi:hypothetical protein